MIEAKSFQHNVYNLLNYEYTVYQGNGDPTAFPATVKRAKAKPGT